LALEGYASAIFGKAAHPRHGGLPGKGPAMVHHHPFWYTGRCGKQGQVKHAEKKYAEK
jgi:hypothetical protein